MLIGLLSDHPLPLQCKNKHKQTCFEVLWTSRWSKCPIRRKWTTAIPRGSLQWIPWLSTMTSWRETTSGKSEGITWPVALMCILSALVKLRFDRFVFWPIVSFKNSNSLIPVWNSRISESPIRTKLLLFKSHEFLWLDQLDSSCRHWKRTSGVVVSGNI